MNAETIEHWLAAVGVPAEVVSIGAEADDAWCLLRGEQGDEWEVFWREQGNRYDWACFSNEQVACFYLFGRLAWTQTASGVLRTAEGTAEETTEGTAEGRAERAAEGTAERAAEGTGGGTAERAAEGTNGTTAEPAEALSQG